MLSPGPLHFPLHPLNSPTSFYHFNHSNFPLHQLHFRHSSAPFYPFIHSILSLIYSISPPLLTSVRCHIHCVATSLRHNIAVCHITKFHITELLSHHFATSQRYHITSLPCYYVSYHYHTTTLPHPHNYVATSSRYHTTTFPHHNVPRHYVATSLRCYSI